MPRGSVREGSFYYNERRLYLYRADWALELGMAGFATKPVLQTSGAGPGILRCELRLFLDFRRCVLRRFRLQGRQYRVRRIAILPQRRAQNQRCGSLAANIAAKA